MEVSGLVSRQIPCFPGAAIDPRSSKPSFSGDLRFPGRNELGASLRTRTRAVSSRFCDEGHVEYYYSGPRCGGNKKEKEMKKKLKLLKGLSELSASSQISTGLESEEGLRANLIWEGAEALLQQLEQVRAEEKELKKRKKAEKARLKAERMKDCDSSSDSSESECGEVIDMNSLKGEVPEGLQTLNQGGVALVTEPSLAITREEDKCCNRTSTRCDCSDSIGPNNASGSSVMEASVLTKVEVCMGKKCKASGGVALLEEFERLLGAEGSVVGCKCMGKCKNGPNVRVINSVDAIESKQGIDDSVRNPTNPLYIGVGLEDVSLIVANLMGEVNKDLGLATAT